jgi:hypothetical protein
MLVEGIKTVKDAWEWIEAALAGLAGVLVQAMKYIITQCVTYVLNWIQPNLLKNAVMSLAIGCEYYLRKGRKGHTVDWDAVYHCYNLKNKCTLCSQKGHNSQNCPSKRGDRTWLRLAGQFDEAKNDYAADKISEQLRENSSHLDDDHLEHFANVAVMETNTTLGIEIF